MTRHFFALALSLTSLGCGQQDGTFELQEIVPRVEEGGFNADINYTYFDAMHLDGMARLDTIDFYGWDLGRSADAICKQGLEGRNNLLPDSAWERICSSSWRSCLYTLSNIPEQLLNDAWGGTYGWWPSDILWIDPDLEITERMCPAIDWNNPDTAAMQRATMFQRTLIDHYDRDLFYSNYYKGDIQLVVTNDGKHSRLGEGGNAGICGVWVYSDNDFKKLKRVSDEGESEGLSSLMEDCGAETVISSAESLKEVEPLTVLRAGTTESLSAPFDSLDESWWNEYSSIGDMLGPWALYGTNYLTRQEGWCGRETCPMFSGSFMLTLGAHFRWALAKDNDKEGQRNPGDMHVVLAECQLKAKENKAGLLRVAGPRTCWHSRIKGEELRSGNQIVVGVSSTTRGD